MVTAPSPLGLSSVTVSLSLDNTVHPVGMVTVSPSFDTLDPFAGCVGCEDGDGLCPGFGETAGDGLDTAPNPEDEVLWLASVNASTVPTPPITSTNATITPTISTHGMRCTPGCGLAPV